MADSPVWFRFFIEDFERDTRDLNPEETGIYLRLMLWYYSSAKPIPNTDLWRVATRIGLNPTPIERPDPIASLRHVLDTYFTCDDGEFFNHKRIEEELEHWRKSSGAGRSAAEKRWRINGSHAGALQAQCIGNTNQNQNQNQKKKKQRQVGSAEASPDLSPVVETLPLRDGRPFPIKQSVVSEFEVAYPRVDVPSTLREMRAWLIANPDRRKTQRGCLRFVNTWLSNAQREYEANG